MNKKFLSAILFGALMVTSTGTFVSCKDYDDDIENLQSQINNLATKSDVEAKLSQLQAAIDAAKAEALKAAAAAEESAEIAKLEAEIAALETCKCDVDAMMKKIQDAVDADMAEYKEELNALIEKAEGLVGKVADYVTSVELIYSYYKQNQDWVTSIPWIEGNYGFKGEDYYRYYTNFSYDMTSDYFAFWPIFKKGESGDKVVIENIQSNEWVKYLEEKYGEGEILNWVVRYDYQEGYDGQHLTYRTVFEKDNVFGKGLPGEMTFTNGEQVQRTVSFVVRVSPTNAVLTKDMISLVNSKGVANDIVEVVDVKPYTGLLTRSESNNGLWIVTSKLTKYVKDEFNAVAADAYGRSVLFAAAVNNTLTTAPERNVISSYDLTMNQASYVGARSLCFWVDNTYYANINNRFNDTSLSLEHPGNGEVNYYELEWKGAAAVAATNLNTDGSPKANSNAYWGDYRSDKMAYPAVQGQPITISLDSYWSSSVANRYAPDVKGLYITLDKKANAIESAPSEWNAWNSYEIDGLNKVFEGTQAQITINGDETINDFIGFRVYAVNHDGTLVDPDGKSFYVYVGTQAVTSVDLILDQPAEAPYNWSTVSSKQVAFSTADWGRATSWEIVSITEADGTATELAYEIGKEILFYKKDGKTGVDEVSTEVAFVAIEHVEAADLKDGVTYVATIAAKAAKGVVATATINFTKALPAFPSDYVYPYTNVLQDNVLHIYPIASNDASKGKFEMNNVWHGLAEEVLFVQTNTADEAIKDILDKTYPQIYYPINSSNPTTIGVAAKFVNPDTEKNPAYLTEIPAKVTYNYGKISLPFENNAWAKEAKNWITTGENIKIVFRNYVADCNIEWSGDVPTLYYPGASGKTDTMPLSALKVTDWYGNAVDLSKDNDYFLAENVDIVLLTGNNLEDEYYDAEIVAESKTTGEDGEEVVVPAHIKFTSKVNKSQGTAVPTTLKVVIKDKFGYVVSKSDLAPFNMSFTK